MTGLILISFGYKRIQTSSQTFNADQFAYQHHIGAFNEILNQISFQYDTTFKMVTLIIGSALIVLPIGKRHIGVSTGSPFIVVFPELVAVVSKRNMDPPSNSFEL